MFGQGLSSTIVQTASAYQAIANGGVRIPPSLVKSCTSADGAVTTLDHGAPVTVVSKDAAGQVRDMLETIGKDGLVSQWVKIPGYRIGGKTGTAQQSNGRGGYRPDYVYSFAGMLPMGLALTNTGLADLAAENLVRLVAPYGPQALLAALFLMTTLLAQVISGPAVAAIVVPLAIGSAQRLGLNPQHMALAVALATSMAFLTPLGHPVNILIMGPGGYRFTDYFKVGLPLTLVVTLVILIILPIVYPL